MADEPLLFIATPRFMTEPTEAEPETALLESKQRVQEIRNRLIANQLRFLTRQTVWPAREYILVLNSGEKVIGHIKKLIGSMIYVQIGNEQRQIDGNEVVAIVKR